MTNLKQKYVSPEIEIITFVSECILNGSTHNNKWETPIIKE